MRRKLMLTQLDISKMYLKSAKDPRELQVVKVKGDRLSKEGFTKDALGIVVHRMQESLKNNRSFCVDRKRDLLPSEVLECCPQKQFSLWPSHHTYEPRLQLSHCVHKAYRPLHRRLLARCRRRRFVQAPECGLQFVSLFVKQNSVSPHYHFLL